MKRCKDCKNAPTLIAGEPIGCLKGHTINICAKPFGELRPLGNPCPDYKRKWWKFFRPK